LFDALNPLVLLLILEGPLHQPQNEAQQRANEQQKRLPLVLRLHNASHHYFLLFDLVRVCDTLCK
jgi:hypothetical protein